MLSSRLLAAPGTGRESGPGWLMIVLHGLGDSMAGYQWLPQALPGSGLNFLLVNAPDPYYGGFSWYDFAQDPGPGIARSRALLFELLDETESRGFPAARTFLFGFSQGALMTIETGLRYPRRLAGLIGISGYPYEPETLLRERSPVACEQRFLLTHGTEDPLIPIGPVREGIRLLQRAGLDIEWHEFAKDHTIIEEEIELVARFIDARRKDPSPAGPQ